MSYTLKWKYKGKTKYVNESSGGFATKSEAEYALRFFKQLPIYPKVVKKYPGIKMIIVKF